MKGTLRRSATALAIISILLSLTTAGLKVVFSDEPSGKIDLFTQKEPYNGIGLNMPSDAFGPEEVVVLYALVTYNEIPIHNAIVTFDVKPPSNIPFILSAETNLTGYATVNFTIFTPPDNVTEDEVFGEWQVVGSVLINNGVHEDLLTFKVDWIVKLISVATVNASLYHQKSFGREGMVGLEITLRNVAMTIKVATIALVIQDSVGVIVNSFEIEDFQVQANEKSVRLYCAMHIPNRTYVGNATVFATALRPFANQSRVAYSPSISTTFFISPDDPLDLSFHDLAVVDVFPSTDLIGLDQSLNVSVIVQNEGTEAESFNVSAYLGDTLIKTTEIFAFFPYSSATLNFRVNATDYGVGNYTVSASVTPVHNEADLTDNSFVDGSVEIKETLPPLVHDVAVLNVSASSASAVVGDVVSIHVVVKNRGDFSESFNVTAFYDSNVIGTLQVEELGIDGVDTLILDWNTSGVPDGNYTLNATASSIPEDADLGNNSFVDGVIEIEAGAAADQHYPNWIWLLLAYLFLLVFIILFYLCHRRRREKKKEQRVLSAKTA